MNVTLDLPAFWAENQRCLDKPFRTDKQRAPVRLPFDDHWLLEKMQLPSTVRYYRDLEYQAAINRQCNDRMEAVIGIRHFRETPAPPPVLRIEHVLGARTELTEGGTPWLEAGLHDAAQLTAKLDALERMTDSDLRALIFSTGGQVEPVALTATGERPVRPAMSRGPATIATSALGTTELMYWLTDEPALMDRFFAVMAETIVRYHRILESETGVRYRGYVVLDDNCALFSPALYECHCLPVLQRLFREFAPAPDDWRYQHSDSDMAHLLPLLARLNFHAVNLGPNLPTPLIRRHLPRAEIQGHVAPFTLRNQPADAVIAEVRRDFEAVGRDGGFLLTTAGSIAAGTKLAAVRVLLWAAQTYCRYDGN